MTRVHLPNQMRELAGGAADVELKGTDLAEVLSDLERTYPKTQGWVLDEQRTIRRHVKVFVNGEVASLDHPIEDRDEISIIPAISGGADDVELLVGTRKGLIVLRGERGGEMEVAGRAFEGNNVEYAIKDPRTDTYLASVTYGHFGPRVYVASDPTGEWEVTNGPAFPEDTGASVERIWTIAVGESDGTVWAGVDPAALFRSDDGGRTWELNRALWNVPGREKWEPGGGGLCLHSISTWPGDANRMAVGISAAGVWITEDGGESWGRGVEGIVPRYMPEEARAEMTNFCIHNLARVAAQPETIYMQFHGGVYRSDDAGRKWSDIGSSPGLASDFGFPMVAHPADPQRAFVIPLASDMDRVTPNGQVKVYETSDGGSSWNALTKGLPQEDGYLTILRQAFCHDGRDPLGLYFGATSGEVFSSADAGQTWHTAARRLPPVLSVRTAG